MCGIAGYVQRRDDPRDAIAGMLSKLAHRGPDGQGVWRGEFKDWRVTLGHRRLSIIDIEGGRQPMGTLDCELSYNGEVYNFPQLREELAGAGHVFATRSDTEVVLRYLQEQRTDGLRELNGMFALALWNQGEGTLLLARDRIGIKPLYYAELPDGGIAFASEMTALLRHPAVARQFDPAGLAGYFFSDYIAPPLTAIGGIQKLPPAHYLVWRPGEGVQIRAYWKLEDQDGCDGDEESLVEELRELLDCVVGEHLVSEVPLGVFLSGGIDSSLVAALAQRHMSGSLKTFSIAFDDPAFDESVFARRVAAHIGSQHVELRLFEETLLRTVDSALGALDEPMADPSIVPTYLLSQTAAEQVKVALGGDGGDELFAGYPTYRAHEFAPFYAAIPWGIRRRLINPIVAALPQGEGYQSLAWKAGRFALRFDEQAGARHLRWMSGTDLPELEQIIPGATPQLATISGDLNSLLALDLQTYLPGSVLTKVDRMSMAHGLEVRPPLLDNRLVDFAFALPAGMKLSRTSKHLLKRAAESFLPREVIHRKKKGFAIPLARWLRGPLLARLDCVLNDERLWEDVPIELAPFHLFRKRHLSGRHDHSKPLWALIVLGTWIRETLCAT